MRDSINSTTHTFSGLTIDTTRYIAQEKQTRLERSSRDPQQSRPNKILLDACPSPPVARRLLQGHHGLKVGIIDVKRTFPMIALDHWFDRDPKTNEIQRHQPLIHGVIPILRGFPTSPLFSTSHVGNPCIVT